MRMVLALLAALAWAPCANAAQPVESLELDRSAAATFTHDINVADLERFSVQIDYSDMHPSTPSFSGGAKASLTLTVADFAGVRGKAATATITLENGNNTSVIDGSYVAINGKRYTEGVDWDRGADSVASMLDLASAIDAHWEYQAAASSNVITVTAHATGTFANSWTIVQSVPGKISTTTWGSGQAYGTLSINGVTLTEGTDFDAITSSHVTANKIATAINANASLAAIIDVSSSTVPALESADTGILTLTADVNGPTEYPISVSDAADLVLSKNKITGGKVSDVNVAGDYITEAAHGHPLGLAVLYSTGSNKTIGGLTDQTTYYVIPRDADTLQLASSLANAEAGTEIDLTSAEDATFTLKPLAFASAANDGFKWQGSNDGETFYDLSTSSAPYHSDSGVLTQFVDYAGKFLRIVFTKPTNGAISMVVRLFGQK